MAAVVVTNKHCGDPSNPYRKEIYDYFFHCPACQDKWVGIEAHFCHNCGVALVWDITKTKWGEFCGDYKI